VQVTGVNDVISDCAASTSGTNVLASALSSEESSDVTESDSEKSDKDTVSCDPRHPVSRIVWSDVKGNINHFRFSVGCGVSEVLLDSAF
jgi:hypothetical protein